MKCHFYFLLCILFVYITSIGYENITLANQSIKLPLQRKAYYHIISESNEDLPNYVQIIVNDDTSKLNYDFRHSIFYYKQDSTFSNINQFTKKSFSPVMWLNKEQIKNGFYLSVECEFDPIVYFNYYMNITLHHNIELILNKDYNFYITEDNYLMNLFLFLNLSDYSSEEKEQNNSITIWVKGNKKISSKLNNNIKYEKHSLYDAYIIKLDELLEYNFSLTIEGETGDYINIGSTFFQNYKQNNAFEKEGEVYGFLKEGMIEQNCFKIYGYENPYLKFFDGINMEINMEVFDYNYKCITLPSGVNELFYLIHNLKTPHYLSGYFSLNPGIVYADTLNSDEYFGYLPTNIEYNFKFITFNVDCKAKIKIYIQNCEDYPFCKIENSVTN